MINAHDLREMAAFVKNEPGVIEGVKAELTSAALTGEDSTILNGGCGSIRRTTQAVSGKLRI